MAKKFPFANQFQLSGGNYLERPVENCYYMYQETMYG